MTSKELQIENLAQMNNEKIIDFIDEINLKKITRENQEIFDLKFYENFSSNTRASNNILMIKKNVFSNFMLKGYEIYGKFQNEDFFINLISTKK